MPETYVMMEWYDGYIPSRHHMAVVTVITAERIVREGWAVYVSSIDPDVIRERAATQRTER